MFLLHSWIAQIEYREWERDFNRRARRGDFVRYDLESGTMHQAPQSQRLGRLGHRIRAIASMARVKPQVAAGE